MASRPIVRALKETIRECYGGTLSAPADINVPKETVSTTNQAGEL
jgi:hypothetical protein